MTRKWFLDKLALAIVFSGLSVVGAFILYSLWTFPGVALIIFLSCIMIWALERISDG